MQIEKLAGVVVYYNPEEKDLENINSYISELDKLYIIDNSDTDRINSLLPQNAKIKYIPNYSNLGVAKALNIGINEAVKDGFKFLLTMDQDSYFDENGLHKLKSCARELNDKSIGIISPWHATKLNVSKPEGIDYPIDVMTSGNIVDIEICKKIGCFKDWLFIDSVDIEFCLNLKKNGYKVARCNNVILHHDLGNIKFHRIFGKEFICLNHSYVRRYYIARNSLYIKKMYENLEPRFCDINSRQRRFIFTIVLFEKDKWRKIRSIFLGKLDYYKGIKGVKKF